MSAVSVFYGKESVCLDKTFQILPNSLVELSLFISKYSMYILFYMQYEQERKKEKKLNKQFQAKPSGFL